MNEKPLLVKPQPIEYIKVENEINFSKGTHEKVQEYIRWNPTFDGKDDMNFLIEGAVNFLIDQDKLFAKHLKQKLRPSKRKTKTNSQNTQEINQNSQNNNTENTAQNFTNATTV